MKKPTEHDTLQNRKENVIQHIPASKTRVKHTKLRSNLRNSTADATPVNYQYDQTIIAIGASTGGPRALQEILGHLPNQLPAAILIVQHIPSGFTKSLADRLNSNVAFTVKEASDKELIHHNTVYIAPGDYHLKVTGKSGKLKLSLSKDAPLRGHRPSVDVLFHSIAYMKNVNKIAVVLTGMGSDGAEGIKNIKDTDKHSVVITESRETAIIYGMPKAAAETNCVDHEVPLSRIGRIITNIILKKGGM